MSDLSKFIKARKHFAFGEQRDYWDHPTTVGWVRMGTEQHPDGCAVVLCVGDEEGTKRMEVGKEHAGKVFVDAIGWMPDTEVTIGGDGWAEFKSPAHSVAVWVNKEAKALPEVTK
jgi:alpha-amylase